MENKSYTRKELYDLIWSEPLGSLAKKLEVQDHELRNLCKKMKIPLPGNGYWIKIRYGKKPIPVSLTEISEEPIITFPLPPGLTSLNPVQLLTKEIENTPGLPLKVPEKLINPHKFIIAKNNRLSDKSHRYSNELIGTNVWNEEINKRTPPTEKWRSYDVTPTGKFRFLIGPNWWLKEIKDGRIPIEDRLAEILAILELDAKKEIERRIESEKQERIRKEKERIEKERKGRREREVKKFKDLFRKAHRWQQAKFLREYLLEVESKANEYGLFSDDIKKQLTWAKKKVDFYDPLSNKENFNNNIF